MAKFLGVDTGGTFTDFILYDDEVNTVRTHKVLSTPQSPEKAILQGLANLSVYGETWDINKLTMIHGSTVATNAILEGKGVRTVYITNKGFADVLTIGRQAREELYNLTPAKKTPLIQRELCLEVNSRLSAQGEHLQQVNEQGLVELNKQLEKLDTLNDGAVKAIAINLLFSFFDDSEELKIEQSIIEHFGVDRYFISRSSDVLPEYKEFERGMTTALNAKVGPLMQGYLKRLEEKIGDCELSIMKSSSGTANAEHAGRYPVNLLLSGPAGGLKGAQTVANASGEEKILTLDMGGTSTDVSIIDKDIGFTTAAKIGGYPVAVPMIDMHTIGAGGGSIARVDAGGLLLVGPESAGAEPGPACYGNGGTHPTVTDANVVLGRLLPQSFLGGNMQLDKDAAYTAVQTIADALSTDKISMSVEQAAQGIIDIVNDHMVRALRVMSIERGEDPKDFILVSFGGAGGLHVCALAEELEMKKALVPVNAGVLSALGMLAADASREQSRTINKRVNECSQGNIEKIFAELVRVTKMKLGVIEDRIKTVLTVDVRYQGQSNALNLTWHGLDSIEQAFHKKHEESYGHQLDINIELVNIRVRAIELRKKFMLPEWCATEQEVETIEKGITLINRACLSVGQKITGPALIVDENSTTLLAKDWCAEVDKVGSLLFTVG